MSIKSVFITGVTGYIGGSIAQVLLQKDYKVYGLVRSEKAISQLKDQGIEPVLGAIEAVKVIQEYASKADAVINAANSDNPYIVETVLNTLEGTGKTFIHTSGSSIVGDKANGEKGEFIFTEDVPVEPLLEKGGRVLINERILAAAKRNIRSIVLVPTMIYGQGLGLKKESIQVPMLMDYARQKGAGVYIGRGENIWSNVHIADLAELYRLALEKAVPGSYFYVENGENSLGEIAKEISETLGFQGKTLSIDMDEAIQQWGAEAAHFALASNSRVDATKAKTVLGWQPKQHTLLEDIASSK
ncbi:NAD-dependent epimerase/dehydratase family protein [Rapidithrix thailandica]|uniref:NAD-dependent epimerase/dehydratase family protein n=1 Tax=Rapidithrix thailandica TaxID=413964 RepID=A0AAW9SER9_9BACT